MEPRWITTSEGVRELAEALAGEPVVALDSESDSLHHYREKVCLLQIGVESGPVWLVDTLAVHDLAPLAAVVADPAIEKAVHGADYDIATLRRDFGFDFANLLDTMLACRFLGLDGVGLAAALEREFGLHLSKGPRTADWSLRPLPREMVDYAADDVRTLVALRHRLIEQLRAIGREAWVREESAALTRLPAASRLPIPADWRRAQGARDLDATGVAAAIELFATREALAERLDRPRFKVAGDDLLTDLARTRPRTLEELARVPRVGRNGGRFARDWLAALERAARNGPAQPAEEERRSRDRPSPIVGARIGRLRAWRDGAAARVGLDPGLVLPQRLIVAVAVAGPRDPEGLSAVPGLRQWRIDAFGDDLLRLAGR
jgi:ribonuclease D